MSTLLNRNFSAVSNTAFVSAGNAVNGAPELVDVAGNRIRVQGESGGAGGRLEVSNSANITFFDQVGRVTGSDAEINHILWMRADCSTAGRWATALLRFHRSGGVAPLTSMLYASLCQPSNNSGKLFFDWQVRTHDPNANYYYNVPNGGVNWRSGGGVLLDPTADLGGYDPLTASGVWLKAELLEANPATIRFTLYRAHASESNDTIGAQLLTWSDTWGPGGNVPNIGADDLGFLDTTDGGDYSPGYAGVTSTIASVNDMGTSSGPGRIIALRVDVEAPGSTPMANGAPDVTQISGQNTIEPQVSGGSGAYDVTVKVENDLPGQAGTPLDFDTTMALVGTDSGGEGETSVPHTFTPSITSKHDGVIKYGQPRVYIVEADDGSTTLESDHTVAEDYYAPPTVPDVAERFLTGDHLIVLIGDSRTQPNEFGSAIEDEYTNAGISATVINRGQASSWLTYVDPEAEQQGWLPESPLTEGDTDNLFTQMKTLTLAELASGDYASLQFHCWLDLNDRRNLNVNPSIHQAAWETLVNALIAEIIEPSGIEGHIFIHDGGFGGDREANATYLRQDLILRDAKLDMDDLCQGAANGVWYGAQDITKGCRENPSYNTDNIAHQTQAGIEFVAARMFVAAVLTALSSDDPATGPDVPEPVDLRLGGLPTDLRAALYPGSRTYRRFVFGGRR